MRFFLGVIVVWSALHASTSTHTHPGAAPHPTQTYTIHSGDTLYAIARRHAMTLKEVLTLNALTRNAPLRIGQKLKVYGYAGKTRTYVVQPGDSPLTLARKFRMPLQEMIRANEIDFRRHRIAVGETLKVRKKVQPKPQLAIADKIVRDARRYLGIRYRWGGNNPRHGIDCSRFAQLVFKKQGITLPRVSGDQYHFALKRGKRVSIQSAKKGDLIFFRTRHRWIGHVGIIIDPKKHLFQQSSSGAGRNNIARYDVGSYRRRLRGIVHMNLSAHRAAVARYKRHASHRS